MGLAWGGKKETDTVSPLEITSWVRTYDPILEKVSYIDRNGEHGVVLGARLNGGGLDGDGQKHGAVLEAGLDAGRLDGQDRVVDRIWLEQ
jgi:hypothetical protein